MSARAFQDPCANPLFLILIIVVSPRPSDNRLAIGATFAAFGATLASLIYNAAKAQSCETIQKNYVSLQSRVRGEKREQNMKKISVLFVVWTYQAIRQPLSFGCLRCCGCGCCGA